MSHRSTGMESQVLKTVGAITLHILKVNPEMARRPNPAAAAARLHAQLLEEISEQAEQLLTSARLDVDQMQTANGLNNVLDEVRTTLKSVDQDNTVGQEV